MIQYTCRLLYCLFCMLDARGISLLRHQTAKALLGSPSQQRVRSSTAGCVGQEAELALFLFQKVKNVLTYSACVLLLCALKFFCVGRTTQHDPRKSEDSTIYKRDAGSLTSGFASTGASRPSSAAFAVTAMAPSQHTQRPGRVPVQSTVSTKGWRRERERGGRPLSRNKRFEIDASIRHVAAGYVVPAPLKGDHRNPILEQVPSSMDRAQLLSTRRFFFFKLRGVSTRDSLAGEHRMRDHARKLCFAFGAAGAGTAAAVLFPPSAVVCCLLLLLYYCFLHRWGVRVPCACVLHDTSERESV